MLKTENATVYFGSNLDVLPTLEDNSVDSIVTDPPYELGFMGKSWDSSGIAYNTELWKECLRVLKPGGHLLSFGGTRTWHRVAVAIEDAGFEVRDSIAWMYGSGFPKSLNVSKAIDKQARGNKAIELIQALLESGLTLKELGDKCDIPSLESSFRDWLSGGHKPEEKSWDRLLNGLGFSEEYGLNIINRKTVLLGGGNTYSFREGEKRNWEIKETAPSTPEAQQWEGWGTALKPAHEPIVVARKPLIGTVAANVLEHGTGALNIDESRIGTTDSLNGGRYSDGKDETDSTAFGKGVNKRSKNDFHQPTGRWPANVILDEYTAGLLDEQSGVRQSGAFPKSATKKPGEHFDGGWKIEEKEKRINLDSGGASRFFYVAKASKADRNEGLEELPATTAADMVERKPDSVGMDSLRAGAGRTSGAKNFHPTVKPTQLMTYLVNLVTPPNGTVLDPFTGSGSTGKAAILSGFNFVGIELTEDYWDIIKGRLEHAEAKLTENKDKEGEQLF